MPFEIVTTTCEEGILKGTKGFCPVAVTEGTPKAAITKLFKLAKRQAEKLDDHRKNTRHFFAHFPLKLEDQKFHLLTRGTRAKDKNGEAGNLVIHQLLLNANELSSEGPAAMLANEKHWFTTWSAQPQTLKPRAFETFPLSPRICKLWKDTTGDSGWAGTPVESWLGEKSCALIATPKVKSRTLIQMMSESQSLMPVESRWKVPISVAAWHPFGMDAKFWSAFDKGTQAEIDVMQHSGTSRIDLSGDLAKASGKFSNAARLGTWVQLESRNGKTSAGSNGSQSEAEGELLLKSPEVPASTQNVPPTQATPKLPKSNAVRPGISSKQLTRSASSFANRWLPSSIFGWVKAIAIALFAITIPVVLWYGYKLSQDIISAAGDVDSPAIMANRGNSSESDTDESFVEEPAESPEPVAPVVVKSPLTPMSVDELRESLLKVDKELIIDIPQNTSEKTHLFTIDQTQADFDSQLFLSVDLLDKRVRFQTIEGEDNAPEQRWDLPLKIGSKETTVASVLYERESGKFFWQWAEAKLSPSLKQNILSGRILFSVEDVSSIATDVFLARPMFSKPFTLFDLAKAPALVKPHLSDALTTKQNFKKNVWSVSGARISRSLGDDKALVENSDFDIDVRDRRVSLRYDQQLIRKALNDWLGSKFSDSIKNQAELDKLLEYHGPFGFSLLLDFSASPDPEPGILISSRTNVLVKGIDSDNAAIYLPRMKVEATDKSIKKFEDEIKKKVAIDICKYLGITDPKTVEAIYRGRKKSSRDLAERIRLAIAGVVYKKICSDIHLPIQFEISRKFRGFNREFTTVAMTWKPELLGEDGDEESDSLEANAEQ